MTDRTAVDLAEQVSREARERRRKELRERFPFTAGMIDYYRDNGIECRVTYAAEGGNVVGAPGPAGVKPNIMLAPGKKNATTAKR